MTMTPRVRKGMLTAHVTSSLGWVGALSVFFAHALLGLLSTDEQVVRATSIAMGLTAWLVIMPLSVATLLTGLVQALGTAWGLLRHYWIVFKLVLTAVATAVLLLKLGPISALADAAGGATFSGENFIGLRTSLALHAFGGLVVLLAAATLGVYKPKGLTHYHERPGREGFNTASDARRALPKWVKVFGGVIVMLLVLLVIMLLTGGHGPSAHAFADDGPTVLRSLSRGLFGQGRVVWNNI